MEISFEKKSNGKHVGYATITDICALHVERVMDAPFEIRQSHVEGGKYSTTDEANGRVFPRDIDTVIEDKVFPVYLELVSDSEVINASITY